MQHAFYQALLAPEFLTPEGLTVWNGSDPAIRFAIYRNNVRMSLADALAENCPVLVKQLGHDFFQAMAIEFICQRPPSSTVLAGYGAELPEWLRDFPPLADWPWLSDLARLELLFIESLHAADPKTVNRTTVTSDTDPSQIIVHLHPSLRLLYSPFAVLSLWLAHQQAEKPESVNPWQAEQMLLFRADDDVIIVAISLAELRFIEALQSKQTLSAALRTAIIYEENFDPQPILVRLQQQGLLLALTYMGEE